MTAAKGVISDFARDRAAATYAAMWSSLRDFNVIDVTLIPLDLKFSGKQLVLGLFNKVEGKQT